MTFSVAEVRLQSPHAEKQFRSSPREVRDGLNRLARSLRDDPQVGTFLRLRRIPRATVHRWEARVGRLSNLYKVDLPGAWRALYTVGSDGPLRVVLVLEVVSHTEYDRLLGFG